MADDLASIFTGAVQAGQQYQLGKFQIQEAPVKLESEKLALKIAQQDFDRRQQMANMLAGTKIPQGSDPLENAQNALLTMGSIAAQTGFPEESAQFISKGSMIAEQRENAEYKQYQEAMGKAKFSEQILGSVTDEASWKAAHAYIKLMTGKPSALEGQPYSPELVATLRDATTKHLDAATAKYRQAQTEREKTLMQADLASVDQRKSAAHLNNVKAGTATKNGGLGIVAKPQNISMVARAIVKDSNDVISMTDAMVAADPIALDVEQKMRTISGLTRPQAIKMAINEAKQSGALALNKPGRVAPGSLPTRALPLPADPSKYEDQKWYIGKAGEVRWYDKETNRFYKKGEGPDPGEPEPEDNASIQESPE